MAITSSKKPIRREPLLPAEDTQNIDEPLAMLRSSATSYFHADGLGSVTSLSNAAGSIANTYDSFGKLTASTGSLVNPFQYTARESDSETGLYYYRVRYYDQSTGRFTREDPLGFYGGDANLYRYVWNRPANFIDFIGEFGAGLSLGGSAEGGAIGGGAGATGSVGVGVFFDGTHPSVGGFGSGGGFAGGPGLGPSYPSCPSKTNWALGGFAGGGLNVFLTNANNVLDLSGPFKTYSFNLGWGVRVLSLQFSVGKNDAGRPIGLFSYGGPLPIPFPTGAGYGASLSEYNTNTWTTSGGGKCPCQ